MCAGTGPRYAARAQTLLAADIGECHREKAHHLIGMVAPAL